MTTSEELAAPPAEPVVRPAPVPTSPPRLSVGRRIAAYPGLGVSIALIGLISYFGVTQDRMLTWGNMRNIFETNSILLVLSMGMTAVVLTGGFDLSVGAMLSLSGIGLAWTMGQGAPPLVAIVLVVLAGALVGTVVNGVLIGRFGLSFLVVTLGSGSAFGALALVWSEGRTEPLYDVPFLLTLGSGTVGGVPWTIVISISVFLVFAGVLRYTGFGRMIYAVGGNSEAARLAGVSPASIRIAAYGIAAGLAALAGALSAARLASASPTAGSTLDLAALAAVLLGGTSYRGGRGTAGGTFLGVVFLGVLSNGITLSGVSAFWQGLITGAVLIAAVALDKLRRGRHEA